MAESKKTPEDLPEHPEKRPRVPTPEYTVTFFLVLVGLLFWLGFGIRSMKGAPPHAMLYVDDARRTYASPPCVTSGSIEADMTGRRVTHAQARTLGYRPDDECRNYDAEGGGFLQEDRSLSGHALQWLGVLGPLPSRWNPDGTWNW
jgi:hypothetical protein